MRRAIGFTLFLLAALSLVGGIEHQTPKADAHRLKGQPNSIQILHRVFDARRATWGCQRRLGRPLTPKSRVPMFRRSTAFRWWALKHKWEPKAVACSRDLRAYLRRLNAGRPSSNVELGRAMAARYGWGSGYEWDALYKLWNHESGWSTSATNPSSGACGIPQRYPCNGLSSLSASSQIAWGLSYIAGRWGSPSRAYANLLCCNWY